MTAPLVRIRYLRPPDRVRVYEQRLVLDAADVKVTLVTAVELGAPLVVEGRTVLEDGAPVVWFTFPGAWHDVGRFHDAAGRFTGLYANVLTPVAIGADHRWETTDLFLDLWLDGSGPRVLDRDELVAARAAGWVDDATAARAEEEVERLLRGVRAGGWPPPVVEAWTLERARAALG